MNNHTKDSIKCVSNIITNNFTVCRNFDDIYDGVSSPMYLTEDQAYDILKQMKGSYLTSYNVAERLAIIGIIPFNDGVAYIFNKDLPVCIGSNYKTIVANTYESLVSCYVFTSKYIESDLLNRLTLEYYKRRGIIYDSYGSFENIEIRETRRYRQLEFRNKIVFDYIFKHGFCEVGANKWSDGVNVIRQKDYQRSVIGYPSVKTHTELNIDRNNMMLIGSIFSPFLQKINPLPENSFGIICDKGDRSSYHFTYFEITFGKSDSKDR